MQHIPVLPAARNLIGGVWRKAASGQEMAMISPIDGAVFAAIAESGPEDVDAAVAAARAALAGDWGSPLPPRPQTARAPGCMTSFSPSEGWQATPICNPVR